MCSEYNNITLSCKSKVKSAYRFNLMAATVLADYCFSQCAFSILEISPL